jgi:hypothetical protein
MKRRCWILLSMALLVGSSGCAGTARRDDGSSIFGPRAWNAPTAPPQRTVSMTPDGSVAAADPVAPRFGLSKYFPALTKKEADAPVLASTKPRPTWFGLRPSKPAATVTYMTDTREQLNRSGPLPTSLPVSLQVPSNRVAADRQVTPTSGETISPAPTQAQNTDGDAATKPSEEVVATSSRPIDFGGEPSKPGEDEVNPLPPAAETGTPATVVNRMPPTPSIDPLSSPSTDRPASSSGSDDKSASDDQTIKASTPPVETTSPVAPEPPKQPTTQVVTAPQVVTPTSTVYASPQGPPPKPTSQIIPSSQAKPSPQGASATDTNHWQRPCLRRLFRRVCKMGEFASPPTAAPH